MGYESGERSVCESCTHVKRGDTILVQVLVERVTFSFVVCREIREVRVKRVRGDLLWWRSEQYTPGFEMDNRLRFADRGVTWVPSWREEEASAFRVRCALVNT
jgi:hypothetical protein